MKRFSALTAVFAFLTMTATAAGLFEYSGLFPADRPSEATISNYMLLDKPRQVELEIVDRQGKPLTSVRAVEIVLTSDTRVTHRSDAGLSTVDLSEPGIYEVKVRPVQGAVGEIGFTLRVKDSGHTPVASSSSVPLVQQPASVSVAKPEIPAMTAVPVAAPAASMPQPAVVPSPATSDTAARPVMTMPVAGGYADPFKPVELQFGTEIPAGVPLDTCVQVFMLDSKGAEKTVPGQCFPAGSQGVRFIPVGLINGAVYHVRAIHPLTRKHLAEFTFATFPEVRLTMGRDSDGNVRLEITWPPLPELMPGEEGQVIRLDMTELHVKSGMAEVLHLAMKPDMPPFGNTDGIEFRGQPWRLSVTIPQAKIASASGSLEATLRAGISGANAPVDVVRSTLSFTGPAQSAAFGTSLPQTSQTVTTIVSTKTEEILLVPAPASEAIIQPAIPGAAAQLLPAASVSVPIAASPSADTGAVIQETSKSAAVPAMEPLSLPKIVPCEDPGTNATLSVLKKFPVGEGGPNDAFSWPKGLTWSSDGTLWVVDSQNRLLLRFLDDGRLLTALGKKGRGPGMLGLPIDIAIASMGIFVSDTAAHAVHHYDTEGSFIRTIGAWGTKTGQLDLPHGVFVDADQVWVTDRGNMKIMRFGLDGVYRGGFGKKGDMEGYITEPVSIRISKDIIWILEGKSGRIQRFSRDGKALGSFPSGAKEPLALEIDPWGCAWVADGEGHRLMRFDPSGRMLMTIQPPAGGRQWIPTSVAVRIDGIVAVGDGEDRSIHLYRIKKP